MAYEVGDTVVFTDIHDNNHLATVARVDEKHWVYLDVHDEEGNPYQFMDIDALLAEETGEKCTERAFIADE